MVDERGDVRGRRQRRRDAFVVAAPEHRDGSTQLLHASPTDLLGRPERLLGRGRVAAQHVAGARDLEHYGGEPVADEVVHVAGDPAPLGQHGLLRQLAAGGAELCGELPLTVHHAAHEPRKHDPQHPDLDMDLGRVLDEADRHGHRSGDQAQRGGGREGRGPRADDEGEERGLEHEGLDPAVTLGRHHRYGHHEDEPRQRELPGVCPRGEGGDGKRGKDRVRRGSRIGDDGEDGDREREDREQPAQLVALRPLGTCHTGTVLRQASVDIPRGTETRTTTAGRQPPLRPAPA